MASRHSPHSLAVVISCEHGGNDVPVRYRRLFASTEAQAALNSHRGWDPGSLEIGRHFARRLRAPLIASTTSRLLIELNRSVGHPRLFSEWTRTLPDDQRQTLLERFYQPYRDEVVAKIVAAQADGQTVLHLSMHTFSPVWDGVERPTDVGLLFDPDRTPEAHFCRQWQRELQQQLPQTTTHRNRPYRGTSDGLTTALRRQFPQDRYLGVELEVNQRYFAAGFPADVRRTLLQGLTVSLQEVLAAPL